MTNKFTVGQEVSFPCDTDPFGRGGGSGRYSGIFRGYTADGWCRVQPHQHGKLAAVQEVDPEFVRPLYHGRHARER